ADTSVNADFALRCKGDSMINARIFDGDIVYIRQQSDVDDGEIAAVLIGEEATLKKVYKTENKLVLRPCNPMYDDLVYSNDALDSVRILGKAIMFTSLIRHGK
ncbi:MAG: XRE family transcriptional regulator, partial [Clostridia bacterium]|nr:XRE family transcriptional regulator [Clostridia bacterium]